MGPLLFQSSCHTILLCLLKLRPWSEKAAFTGFSTMAFDGDFFQVSLTLFRIPRTCLPFAYRPSNITVITYHYLNRSFLGISRWSLHRIYFKPQHRPRNTKTTLIIFRYNLKRKICMNFFFFLMLSHNTISKQILL